MTFAGLETAGSATGPWGRESRQLFAAGPFADLGRHELAFGRLTLERIDRSFISDLEGSGLTGRGGAAFSSWRKMVATNRDRGRAAQAVVVANGAEGEPLSFKDKTLLAHAPHLVLDGLLAAGRAVGAGQLYIYAGEASLATLRSAVAARRENPRIMVVPAPETFIAGEASAVVNSISNGVALPMDLRRRLSSSGVRGRPTLVFNVETLAHMALIARHGAAWFREAGTIGDPGTRLVSRSGYGAEQVLEVEGGASLPGILSRAGLDPATMHSVLVGGFHGEWVHPAGRQLSPPGKADGGVHPGAGVLHVLPAGECGLEATAGMVRYLAAASARQCGPCMFGLPAMSQAMDAVARGGHGPGPVQELERVSRLVDGRGSCHHPDGSVRLVRSALAIFSDDVAAHLAGSCTRFATRDP